MESIGEAVDDQSSGWSEVKKKHRTSAKFSVQSWSGGFSGKSSSGYQHNQPSLGEKGENLHAKRRSQLPKRGAILSVHGRRDVNSASVSNRDGNCVSCPDKSMVKPDSELGECPSLSQMFVCDSSAEAGDAQKILDTDKPDVTSKIKWGDLEDDVLVTHHENNSRADVNFGGTTDNKVVARKLEKNCHLISDLSCCTDLYENTPTDTSSIVNICPDQSFALTDKEDIIEVNYMECSEISSNDMEVPIVNCKLTASNDDSNCTETHSEQFKLIQNYLSSNCPAGEAGMESKVQVPVVMSEVNESKIFYEPVTSSYLSGLPHENESIFTEKEPEIPVAGSIVVKLQLPAASAVNESRPSELPVANKNSDAVVILLDSKSLPPDKSDPEISGDSGRVVKLQLPVMSKVNESLNGNSGPTYVAQDCETLASKKCGPEVSGESTVRASAKDCGGSLDKRKNNELLKAQTGNPLEEGDAGESKERFRERLWCFLFENLNRAVDELYLLCELECDMEQMKEAILVLQEAASDFIELTTRVQGFENMKGSSSQSADGAPVPLKSDLRRPHALSWEVRRMTTSPHRAEILSSSLEAFKKIQQERANMLASNNGRTLGLECNNHHASDDNAGKLVGKHDITLNDKDSMIKSRKPSGISDRAQISLNGEKRNIELGRSNKVNFMQSGLDDLHNYSSSNMTLSRLPYRDSSAASAVGKNKRESEADMLLHKKEKTLAESTIEKSLKSTDPPRGQIPLSEKDKERRNSTSWKSMDAWKEKRNWEDILSSPFRVSARLSHSPGISRKSAERARILHDKLMSPEKKKKKKSALDLKKEAEEKHARAMRIRSELENERVQKLQRTSEKLNRVNEWQAVRTMRLREGMHARHQRSESRHEAFLAQVVKRAGDESSKVNEVRFITSLNEENKKLMLRQKLHDSELRRAEKLQEKKTKQKEDMAKEEAVLERRRLIEAEKLQRLAETQRKKEEAQVRREEERKASSALREARAIEQLRRREERAKAQQEEAELLAQKLAERLNESEQRRKFYLEQIRERASMDFRDQSSPLVRRSMNKEVQGRSTPTGSGEVDQGNIVAGGECSTSATGNVTLRHSLKRRIKKIRQRLMALKYEFSEPAVGSENTGIGYRTAVVTARAKLGRWLQELKRLRQARKGAASIGLITAEMVKFLEGKDPELQASRQAGLLDFIASALPASHTSRPEACQVTIHLLKLLRVVLSIPSNRSYFLAQNLLPPIIPMLSTALENYIKIAASLNVPGISNLPSSKTSTENFDSISEVLDNFLWIAGAVIGHTSSEEQELQMRNGLLELVIAYQVIHRLRDLFALYDRPQAEGSPFPSSILLSIHLLVVLTYRHKTYSSIDWESSPIQRTLGFEYQEAKLIEADNFMDSSANMTSEECGPPLSVLNGDAVVSFPDASENKSLHESCSINTSGDSLSICKDSEKKPTYSSMELNRTKISSGDVLDESEKILNVEKDEKHLVNIGAELKNDNTSSLKKPVAFLLSAISETGLVSLPSLLTAVLLQANNRLSSEQGSYVLPSNFEEVATGVLKVFNNLALLDITFMQRMLARPDLKMEFFHLMSFLLSHCTGKWKVASDQVGLLLHESLLLLGYFALFHPENQAVLSWGKSPTILHKVCDLPFVFFSDPELMPVLGGTLVAACYRCEQNKSVVLQELSMDMLLSVLKSCRNSLLALQTNQTLENLVIEDSGSQQITELKKSQGDMPLRSYRAKSTRVSSGKANLLGSSSRVAKLRSQRDSKATKTSEEMPLKQNPLAPETSVMLHCRFPSSFIDKAEQFFLAATASTSEA